MLLPAPPFIRSLPPLPKKAAFFWTLPATPSRPLATVHGDAITAVGLSADQATIVTASTDKNVRLSTFANGALVRAFPGPPGGRAPAESAVTRL